MKKLLLLISLFFILPTVSFAQAVPTISNIGQYKLDGVTPLGEGAITNEQSVVFRANVASATGRPVKLQVELRKTNWALGGWGPFLESDFVLSGSVATVTKEYLAEGLHHWQYRTVDDLGNTSDWQEYGIVGNTDFIRTNSAPIPVPADVKTDYSIGFNPSSIVFDNINSSLWLLNNSDNTISQMAVSDGSFVGSPHPVGNAVSSMIFDDVSQSVWALSVGSWEEMSTLSKMSAQDGSVVARYTVGQDSRHLAFDKNTNSIWVVNGNPMEPSFSKVGIFSEPSAVETIPALLPFSDLIAFEDPTKTLWATQWDMDDGIYGTNIDTNTFAGQIGTFSIGHRALLYENFTKSLWVDGVDEESSAGYLQLDPSAQMIVGRYSVGDGYGGIVFDSVNKSMWTASGTALTRINLVTKEVTNYDMPGISLSTYDGTTNSLWATSGTNMISKISVEKLLLAKPSPAPVLSSISQFKSDGTTAITESATTTESTLVFSGTVLSPNNNQVKLQVEIKSATSTFDGTNLVESGVVASGSIATTTSNTLTAGSYHWRARAMDDIGNSSDWQEFGTVGNTDVVVAKSTVRNINVAIILAEPVDVAHSTSTPAVKPCKLDKFATTTYSGYNKDYYDDLGYCINDYYKEVSHGSLNFAFTIFDKGGAWYKITDPAKTESYYGTNDLEDEFVIDAITETGQDFGNFDVVAVVHSGVSEQSRLITKKTDLRTLTWPPQWQPLGIKPLKLIIAEKDPLGFWAHETGHLVGILSQVANTSLPDLYKMGNVGKWDLMSEGGTNGGIWGAIRGDGTNPPYLSSYNQEFLGWLKEDVHSKSDYGTHWINSLETSNFGDTIFRYNLEDNVSTSTQKYYIIEARNRDLKTWDSSLPDISAKHLVLYYVDTRGGEKYGYAQDGSILAESMIVGIPGNNSTSTIYNFNDGILNPSLLESYDDYDNLIKISAVNDQIIDGKYEIAASIKQFDPSSLSEKVTGVILRPINVILHSFGLGIIGMPFAGYSGPEVFTTDIKNYVIKETSLIPVVLLLLSLISLYIFKKCNLRNPSDHKIKVARLFMKLLWFVSVLYWVLYVVFLSLIYFGVIRYVPNGYDPHCGEVRTEENSNPCAGYINLAPSLTSTPPDLDLHAVTPDGKHVGMNYVTGEYENQIPGSIVSGDNQGIPEWIYVPEGTQVKYYVSAHDNDEFLKQNPQIASSMATTTDSYSLYARTIDPAVGIFTSPILENQTITPTEEKSYVIPTSGVDVSIEEVKDFTAPVTTATPAGTLGSNNYYISAVTVTLITEDIAPLGEVASGVASTKYSLDSGITWDTYGTSTPLVIATEGATSFQYYSVDNSGNSETAKTLLLNIDTVAPTIFASDTSAEQISENGTFLMVPVTIEDNIDPQPTFTTDKLLTQIFAPGVTNILLTAQDMAGNVATSSIAVTIYSSPEADPDGDGVPNQDDVKPFDTTVFANLIIPSEYALWEKESFDLPFSVAGKGDVTLSLSNTYYRVGNSPVKDSTGATVPATVTTIDGVITVSFAQSTKELKTYTLTLTTTKGNTKERDSIKKKRDHEGDEERRHELEKELKFANAEIALSITNSVANKTTSQISVVNIYDKQQTAQLQYKYKDTNHSTTLLLKSDDVLKLKKGQPLELTVKVTGIKKNVPFTANIAGNFTMLNVVQEEEHDNDNDRKQTKFSLFYPLSTQSTQENITITTTVNGIIQTDVVGVRFEE